MVLSKFASVFSATICASAALSAAAHAAAWDGANDPANMLSANYESRLSAAPLEARMTGDKQPWDETYWPTIYGGIAYRWNWPGAQIRTYRSPSLAQLRTWSEAQIAQLSPAEKYDIYVGDFTYPTARDQNGRKGMFTASWSGLCDGWSASAIHYPEPGQVTLTSVDGIRIPFGSSDIKGLLSFNYSIREFRPAKRVGLECTKWKSRGSAYCRDVNAGAFHLVLTNQLGLRQQSFVAEIDQGKEVWNQPILSYSFKVLKSGAAPYRGAAYGTTSMSLVRMEMTFPEDDETDDGIKTRSHMHPTIGTKDYLTSTKVYYYWLELGSRGEILGGEWTRNPSTGFVEHPDFLWTPNQVPFRGYYSAIKTIYERSRGR